MQADPMQADPTLPPDLPYLDPGSLYWRHMGDVRSILFGPRLLILQVAHPAVGAGVADHSDYQDDPYGRLTRTLRSLFTYVYGTRAEAEAEAARLRELHTSIKGTDGHGRRYSGRDPKAMLWVHATFFEPFLTLADDWLEPLTAADLEQGFDDWRKIGRLLGLRDRDMPATIPAFRSYWDDIVANTLEDNASVRELLDWTFTEMRPPVLGKLPEPMWRSLWRLPVGTVRLITVGSLPPQLRARFGEPWTPAQQRRYERLAAVARRSRRALPDSLRYLPIAAKAVRRERRRRGRQVFGRCA